MNFNGRNSKRTDNMQMCCNVLGNGTPAFKMLLFYFLGTMEKWKVDKNEKYLLSNKLAYKNDF